MKHKSNPFLAAVFAVSAVSICQSSFGAQIYKDVTTADMNTVANWSTVFNAATPNPGSIGTTDTLRFNEMFAPTSGTNYTASISADLTAGGIKLDFGSGGGGAPGTGNVIINGTNTLTLNGTLSGDSQYANAIFVLNSATGGSLTVNPNILIGTAGTQIVASRALNINGTLNWGTFGMTNNIAGGTTTVAGVVSGSGNWSKSGGGTYYFSNAANTFSSTVTATGGTLKVNKLADGGSNSSLGAGSSTITLTGSTLEYAGTTTDSTNRSITMGGNATISNTGSGTVSFTAANVSQSGTASARTLTLTGSNTGSNTFGSIIGDSGTGVNITSLAKSGAGTWIVSGANTYTGTTNVTVGTLTVSGTTNGTSAVTVGGGASLVVATGGTLTTAGVLGTATATGANITVQSGATLNAASANIAWNPGTFLVDGTLALTGSLAVATNASGTISGAGSITAGSFSMGNATTTVNFTNTGSMAITGDMTLAATNSTFSQSAGTISANGILLNSSTSNTYALTGGRLNLGANGIGGTSGTKTVNLGAATVGARADWSSALAMSLTNAATGTTFNTLDSVDNTTARNISLSGVLSGSGQLIKAGAGTLTLSGTNTYNGATNINAGKLVVNGNISTSSITTVKNTGTLGGSGTVGALIAMSGGTVAPGNSPGILSAGNTDLQPGSTLALELGGTSAGVEYDRLNVTGTTTLAGVLNLAITGTYANNDLLFLLVNDGGDAISGAFSNYAEGANFTLGGQAWTLTYLANNTGLNTGSFTGGNDVALMAVPEPGAALLGGLGLLCLLRRRRA